MIHFDGKADMEFFYSLLPPHPPCGRLGQLRVITQAVQPLGALSNPFHCSVTTTCRWSIWCSDPSNLHDEFFGKHQLKLSRGHRRILAYTGLKFNFYDVLVMAIE